MPIERQISKERKKVTVFNKVKSNPKDLTSMNQECQFSIREDEAMWNMKMYDEKDPDIELINSLVQSKSKILKRENIEIPTEKAYIKCADNENDKEEDYRKMECDSKFTTKKRSVQSPRQINNAFSKKNSNFNLRNFERRNTMLKSPRNSMQRIQSARVRRSQCVESKKRQSDISFPVQRAISVVGKSARMSLRASILGKKILSAQLPENTMAVRKKCALSKTGIQQNNSHKSISSSSSSQLISPRSSIQKDCVPGKVGEAGREVKQKLVEIIERVRPVSAKQKRRKDLYSVSSNNIKHKTRSRPLSARVYRRPEIIPQVISITNQMPCKKIRRRPISAAVNTKVIMRQERSNRIDPAKNKNKYTKYLNELEKEAMHGLDEDTNSDAKALLKVAKKLKKNATAEINNGEESGKKQLVHVKLIRKKEIGISIKGTNINSNVPKSHTLV